jgi:ribosomal protein L7Ae-like RNA K-turn-binding protein
MRQISRSICLESNLSKGINVVLKAVLEDDASLVLVRLRDL